MFQNVFLVLCIPVGHSISHSVRYFDILCLVDESDFKLAFARTQTRSGVTGWFLFVAFKLTDRTGQKYNMYPINCQRLCLIKDMMFVSSYMALTVN